MLERKTFVSDMEKLYLNWLGLVHFTDASRPCEILYSDYSSLPIPDYISENINLVDNFLVNECNYSTNPPVKSLKCWYTNANSLINKLDELQCRIKVTFPDILCVTEVYPKNYVYDVSPVLLQIDGYDCFVPSFSRGSRGVCVCICEVFFPCFYTECA